MSEMLSAVDDAEVIVEFGSGQGETRPRQIHWGIVIE